MNVIALVVLATVAAISIWAWRAAPGRRAADEFAGIWRGGPWGKQLLIDFLGLEIVLALWMLIDAAAHGTWLSAVVCIVAMPIFGSMAAAAYWLLRMLVGA